MKPLILYATRYGVTARCAGILASRLPGGADLIDLGSARKPDLDGRGVVILGGSIYAGRIQTAVSRFCDRHREELLQRRVALFICCLYGGEQAEAQLNDAFPPWLLGHSFSRRPLGGAVHQSSLKPLDRLLFERITGLSGDLDRLDQAAIDGLAADVAAEIDKLPGPGPEATPRP